MYWLLVLVSACVFGLTLYLGSVELIWGRGGVYIIFDLGLEAKIAVPAVSPHLTLYSLCWNSYFGLQYEVKNDI